MLLGLLGTEQFKAKYNPIGRNNPIPGCQYFQETGFSICGDFLTYWQANGGLAQQGYPITDVGTEQNQPPPAGDGQVHQVQYFQRARFERHDELGGKTLLGLLGAEQYNNRNYHYNSPYIPPPASNPPAPAPQPQPTPQPTPAPTQPPVQAPATGVQFISVQGGRPVQYASVTVQTAANAYCTIDYYTPHGTHSVAQGLESKNADGAGRVSWSWKIGTRTESGTGEVDVTCGGGRGSTPITIG